MYISVRGFVRKSTKCRNPKEAKEFASNGYEDHIVGKPTFKVPNTLSFDICTDKIKDTQKREILSLASHTINI